MTETDAFGFYWTEGKRGLVWAVGAVPTKGGTTFSAPCPPAVWMPGGGHGTAIVTPPIEAAEVFQGFHPGWTMAAPERHRWKLVGNAVSTGVARWVGTQVALDDPSHGEFKVVDSRGVEGCSQGPAGHGNGVESATQRLQPPTGSHRPIELRWASECRRGGSAPWYDDAFTRAIDEHLAWQRARSS